MAFLIYNAATFAISLLKDSVCPQKTDFSAVFGRLKLVCESNKIYSFHSSQFLYRTGSKYFNFLESLVCLPIDITYQFLHSH